MTKLKTTAADLANELAECIQSRARRDCVTNTLERACSELARLSLDLDMALKPTQRLSLDKLITISHKIPSEQIERVWVGHSLAAHALLKELAAG